MVRALQLIERRRIGNLPRPYKVPDVCNTCNNGWMSRLEQAAKRVMPGLIDGKRKLLAPFDQFILATWACKTALTFDAALPVRYVPGDVGTRLFYTRGYPLQLTFVSLGHDPYFQDDAPGLQIPHLRDHQRVPLEASEGSRETVLVMFQFRRLLVTIRLNYPEDILECTALPDRPYFERMWPPTDRPIAWLQDLERDLRPLPEPPEDPPADAAPTIP